MIQINQKNIMNYKYHLLEKYLRNKFNNTQNNNKNNKMKFKF